MTKGALFEHEIREQPEAIARLLAEGQGEIMALAARLRATPPTGVVVAARGSSDNAARYAQYLLGAHNSLTVALAAPSLITLYGARPSFAGTLVVGISQSGRSPDVAAVVAEARRQGAITAAFTSDATSPVATAAEHVVHLRAGEERAVTASKTYTAELVALAMLSATLASDEARLTDLGRLPGWIQAAIDGSRDVAGLAVRFRYAERFVVLGRGFHYATAFEVALKIQESGQVMAQPYSTADFRHGPIALMEAGLPVVLVAPSGRGADDADDTLGRLRQSGAELVAISDRPGVLADAVAPLPLPPGVPEWLGPAVAVVPGQLWALALARVRGLDPDRPRGLHKITETR